LVAIESFSDAFGIFAAGQRLIFALQGDIFNTS